MYSLNKKTKHVFSLFLMSLFVVTAILSCKKDDNNSNDETLANTISAKWEISDPNSTYASFEFNKDGNYIVVENENGARLGSISPNSQSFLFQKRTFLKAATHSSAASESNLSPIHFGTYKIEGNKITLSGFGVIDIISITAEEFTFSFTLEATGERGEYVASKAEEPISSSSRTDMFCRTWLLEKITIDETSLSDEDKASLRGQYGENWKSEMEREGHEEYSGLIVLFSKAGTYLVLYTNGEAGLSEWKWTNQEETALHYSWDNWEDDWDNNVVFVKELSASSLQLQEKTRWLSEVEIEWVFHLVLQ